ncbi:MAG TPA: hypothetical protein VEZ70_13275 [Allosphingosinicella sp.]|nr:hypothetical protein [Allosphingosinicella sp.]
MDSVRAFDEELEYSSATDEEGAIEAPPEIGVDERRMHVRAYNYWVSLLDGRPYPSIHDLNPQTLGDFGPHSVLLDFTGDANDAKVVWLGRSLREECELIGDIRKISDVPKRSLLSRLTDHYMQIIANCAPIGFEAEFVGQRGRNTMYRGILMPFSASGESIDFIYGVINWKEIADSRVSDTIARDAARALSAAPAPAEASPVWADGPNAEPLEHEPIAALPKEPDWDAPELPLDEEAGLADRLCAARETAEAARGADTRSRAALYRALGQAYAFARAAEADAAGYAEILDDAGLKAQARAPMTPVVKLIFGIDYDKARLTEFASALCWARRQDLPGDAFRTYLERFDGGLKAMVQAERQARRPVPTPDKGDAARAALRRVPTLAEVAMDSNGDEFVLLLARRAGEGRLALIGTVRDAALTEKAILKVA